MGLSNILPTGGDQGAAPAEGAVPAEGATPAKSPDFGQRLGNYFESKYPIAGGLAQAVFGNNQAPAAGAAVQPATAPLAAMPQAGQQDTSMLAMNAQPKQGGGGLEALLKLFAA
jgi:hypothetical protein